MKGYAWNVLIAFDQLINTLFAGDPDETISSRAGKLVRSGKRPAWVRIVAAFTGEQHLLNSIEEDEAISK